MQRTILEALREIQSISDKLPQPYKTQLQVAKHKIIMALEEKFTQLEDGLIPAGMACHFKDKCPSVCHKKEPTENSFSCASARALDMIEASKKVKDFIN